MRRDLLLDDLRRGCSPPWAERDARGPALRRQAFGLGSRRRAGEGASLFLRGLQLAHLHALHRVKEARMNVCSDLLGWASSSDHMV